MIHAPISAATADPPLVDVGLFCCAQAMAAEHVLWAAGAGQRPQDVLDAIGSARRSADWTVVLVEVALAAIELLRAREGEA